MKRTQGLSFLSAFFLALSLLAAVVLLDAKATLFNERFYTDPKRLSACAANLYATFAEEVTALGMPGNIPESVMTDAVDAARFERALTTQLQAHFRRETETFTAQNDAAYQRFLTAFTDYAQTQTDAAPPDRQSLETLAADCAAVYARMTDFPAVRWIAALRDRFDRLFRPMLVTALAAAIACAALIWATQTDRRRALRGWITALLGAALTAFCLPAVLYLFKPYARLSISPVGVRWMLTELCDGVLQGFLFAAALLAAAAGALYLIYRRRD